MKDYLAVIVKRLGVLIERVRTNLDENLRAKIITIITIDVQERDVIANFVNKKITDVQSFHTEDLARSCEDVAKARAAAK